MNDDMYGLEDQLFLWEDWDEMGMYSLHFYNCELKVPIGYIPAGTKFPSITMDFAHSCMQINLDKDGKNYITFKLNISVGEEIKE